MEKTMKPIPKSGYFNTNNFGRIALLSYEEVLGKGGINALLHLAGLPDYIDNYPPANMDKGFDFSDYTAILVALEEIYGPRGGRGLALRAGRATFKDIIDNYGAMAGVADLAFKILPLQMKMSFGLRQAAKTFSDVSDQVTTLEEKSDTLLWTVHRCPSCWGRSGIDKPVCFVTVGFLQASLNWVSNGREFRVNESRCCAMGDSVCEFIIQKEPIS
jgi:predicted hydrocarbon binding protein